MVFAELQRAIAHAREEVEAFRRTSESPERIRLAQEYIKTIEAIERVYQPILRDKNCPVSRVKAATSYLSDISVRLRVFPHCS